MLAYRVWVQEHLTEPLGVLQVGGYMVMAPGSGARDRGVLIGIWVVRVGARVSCHGTLYDTPQLPIQNAGQNAGMQPHTMGLSVQPCKSKQQ